MSIRFDVGGRGGTLDVVKLAKDQHNAQVIKVENGIVHARTEDGKVIAFSLAKWADKHGATIMQIDGFNGPDTALDEPPTGMNYIDQATFYNDGKDMNTLQELFPKSITRNDGRVVVLDHDGLWKTMWSPMLQPDLPPLSFPEQVAENVVNDPRLVIRTAGVQFMFALAGMKAKTDEKGYKIKDVQKMLEIIRRNAPHENKFQIGKVLNQTSGIDQWKFNNALLAPEEVAKWLRIATKYNSFQYRMLQVDMTEMIVDGMRAIAIREFASNMDQLKKLPETKRLMINLKALFSEFISFLMALDIMRDISATTGLNEWIEVGEDKALDASKLPETMPAFVKHLTRLLKWLMPIVNTQKNNVAKGLTGFKSIMAIMMMVDQCLYSLAGVPDHSAKYKMFMALKRLQAQIESKLAFIYQPNPLENPDGMKENPFMAVKSLYAPKREVIYTLCQQPKESWNNTLLGQLRNYPNIERFYDTLPKQFADLIKSFAAMDVAYDMQPWVDVGHAERTHDAFSQQYEDFGLTPPEAGYLAKNSPRAVYNISEALLESAAYISELPEQHTRELLRNPWLLAQLLKTVMTASVNREIGVTETLSKFGINGMDDNFASPDPTRIWEDPEIVQKDIDYQLKELMGQMAMEQMAAEQQGQAQNAEATAMQESARDEGQAEKAGPGPGGPPMPVRKGA